MRKILVIAIACILLFSSMLVVGGSRSHDEQKTQPTDIGKIKFLDVLLDKLSNLELSPVFQSILQRILNFFGYDGGREATFNGGQITLFAGQDMDVGYVEVTNDADNIYVEYVLTDLDWCITETHVHIGELLDDFPLNKKGNPQVGLFDYPATHDCVPSYTYTIPLNGWGDGDDFLIAAHAIIEKTETGTITPTLSWLRSTEPGSTLIFPGFGGQWMPYQGFAIPLDPTQLVWDKGLYSGNPAGAPPGREYASWLYTPTDPDGGSYNGNSDLRRFQAMFTIPAGHEVVSGSMYAPHYTNGIPINDNVYIFLNGQNNLLFWGGTRVNQIPGGSYQGMAGVQALRGASEPKESDRWYIPGTIPEFTDFVSGTNYIDIFTEENERWGGLGKLMLELGYEHTYTETAWAYGTRFVDKGNWATYFEYIVDILECPGITGSSSNIEKLSSIPSDVRVGALEHNTNVRVWKEFEGTLTQPLQYDLAEGDVATDGVPIGHPYIIPSGTDVCIFYVHYDGVGESYQWNSGSITFGADILGVILSGGAIGDFANKNLMFTADNQIGYPGTTYPPMSGDNYKRGYDVNWNINTDDIVFSGDTVNFDTFVAEAHDSFRVIVPMV